MLKNFGLLLLDQDLLLLGNELRLEQGRQYLQDVTRGHVALHHPLAYRRIGMPIRDAMVHREGQLHLCPDVLQAFDGLR